MIETWLGGKCEGHPANSRSGYFVGCRWLVGGGVAARTVWRELDSRLCFPELTFGYAAVAAYHAQPARTGDSV